MSGIKTQRNDGDVRAFLSSVENKRRREDAFVILDVMTEVTGEVAEMWGASIIGFGRYQYINGSGKTADWMYVGFSPRKQSMTLYIMDGFDEYDSLLGQLGKHKTGKSCLYINKLADVDMDVLKKLVAQSVDHMRTTNTPSTDD